MVVLGAGRSRDRATRSTYAPGGSTDVVLSRAVLYVCRKRRKIGGWMEDGRMEVHEAGGQQRRPSRSIGCVGRNRERETGPKEHKVVSWDGRRHTKGHQREKEGKLPGRGEQRVRALHQETKRGTEGDKQEMGQGGAGGLHDSHVPTRPLARLVPWMLVPHCRLQARPPHWALSIARSDEWKQGTMGCEWSKWKGGRCVGPVAVPPGTQLARPGSCCFFSPGQGAGIAGEQHCACIRCGP